MRDLSLKAAVAAGGIGWLLPWPYLYLGHLFGQLISGRFSFQLYELFRRGEPPRSPEIGYLAAGLAPVAGTLFFLFYFRDLSRPHATTARRAASGAAAALMLAAAGGMIWLDRLFQNAIQIPPAPEQNAILLRLTEFLNPAVPLSWTLLFALFAACADPLRARLTRWLAALTALEMALTGALVIYDLWSRRQILIERGFRPLALANDTLQFLSWALLLAFLLALRRESRVRA